MPLRSRFESLPPEVLSCILTRCSRRDLVKLAQTCCNLRVVCRKELVNYLFTMDITSNNLKSWIAYFREENTLLTRGARSLDISIPFKMTMQDLLDAFDEVDPTVFDVNARPIHTDASRILPLSSSLRKLSLKVDWMYAHNSSSDILLLLLLRTLPERCPHLEELSIQAHFRHPSDEFDECIHRLTHLRKLHLEVQSMPKIPNRLSLLPASLTDIYLRTRERQTQEEVATTVAWVRGVRRVSIEMYVPQGIANVLMILSRGDATYLTHLRLREVRHGTDPATTMSLREALTVGLREFSLLCPPLYYLSLTGPSAWSDSLHLPLLHTAVASTLVRLCLEGIGSCIFPSHLSWPCLRSLELNEMPKMGYQGPLIEPIFPVLTALAMYDVDEIQAPEDLFPALETINWRGPTTTPEQMASLVQHDIKRIDMTAYDEDIVYEPLWEAMGEHTIDVIALQGFIPDWMRQRARNGERIFPRFPNIRELTILQHSSYIP